MNQTNANQEMLLTVSASPHIRDCSGINRIMWDVVAALTPAVLWSFYTFGIPAVTTTCISVATCVAVEYLIQKWRKIPVTVSDGSAVVTGLLLAMVIPAIVPWYLPLTGAVVAIGIAKHTMGGLGNNIFNPALIGRAFLMASWPVAMTTWPMLGPDATTAATPLAILKHEGYGALVESFHGSLAMYRDLFIGARSGSAGEVSVVLLLVGAVYLVIRRVIDWQVPLAMIVTVG
ncbi:MAG: RnfABCDGE type electron transport complex subunit D, partial [Negativicutes bacterium]|nr:RnfABCDGE type electron transport complex subunit D [Negativicutes bacterium]